MKQIKNIYCDMDGVLANFDIEPNAVERFRVEKGFFKKLKPIDNNVRALRFLNNVCNVYILSASPNKRADKDKIKWLEKYVPSIPKENIIICRNGQKKVDFMKTNDGILLDDYGKNINEWLEKNTNKAFKISNDTPIEKYIEKILFDKE